jgi:hypothetical protein
MEHFGSNVAILSGKKQTTKSDALTCRAQISGPQDRRDARTRRINFLFLHWPSLIAQMPMSAQADVDQHQVVFNHSSTIVASAAVLGNSQP